MRDGRSESAKQTGGATASLRTVLTVTLSFAKTPAGGKSLICRRRSGENPRSMITLLRHLLRLLPFLCSLDKDAPHGRPIERPELGKVIPIREVAGLHHRYVRQAA